MSSIAAKTPGPEITKVCANLIGGISRNSSRTPNGLELRDEAKKPVFRKRIVAQTLS